MGAGANSSPRALRVTAVVTAVIGAICAAAPATAGAVGPAGLLPDTTSAAVSTAEQTAAPAARAVEATVEPIVRPAATAVVESAADGAPAAGAITPATAAVTPATAAVTPATADTPPPARARVARTASKRAGAAVHPRRIDRSADERAASRTEPASPAQPAAPAQRSALAAAQGEAGGPVTDSGDTAPANSAPQPQPALGPTGASASGASTSFLFGGGLALLMAALLLAGPGLLRRLTLPPAVCRPAAFVLVLERPG